MALMTKQQFDEVMRAYGAYRGYEYLPEALTGMYSLYCKGLRNEALTHALERYKVRVAAYEAKNALIDQPLVDKRPRQVDMVIEHLQRFGCLSDGQIVGYGIRSINAVITKARKLGYEIANRGGVYELVEEKA